VTAGHTHACPSAFRRAANLFDFGVTLDVYFSTTGGGVFHGDRGDRLDGDVAGEVRPLVDELGADGAFDNLPHFLALLHVYVDAVMASTRR